MSPGYPELSNIERFCNYKITTEPNTVISVKFLDFDIKDSSVDASGCAFSSLRVSICELAHSKTHVNIYISTDQRWSQSKYYGSLLRQ